MARAYSFSNLYSHPDKYLEEHLNQVAQIAVATWEATPVTTLGEFSKNDLTRLIKICGLAHDLGKSTNSFQEYLFSENKEKANETRHSLLSAIATFFLVQDEFREATHLSEDQKKFLSFVGFLAVKRHHGNLQDVLAEAFFDAKEKEALLKQIGDIDADRLSVLVENLKSSGLPSNITRDSWSGWVEAFSLETTKLRRELRNLSREKNLNWYFLTNLVFSLLIDADKSEATGGEVPRKAIDISPSIVSDYKSTLKKEETCLNQLREEAYQKVVNQEIDLTTRIFSLNLPTGLGKTFTSFAFVLRLREKIKEEKGYTPRIIYSLPFLSIIEQNAEQIEKTLINSGLAVDSSVILKHHHLSDIYYQEGTKEFEPDQAKILIEGWNAEIVVTTFVQFFHTLISNRNSTLRKFHRLAGSIVILDEVQSIPFKYWLLLKEVFRQLTSSFNSYIILVTATQPLILEKEEVFPLVDPQKYFPRVNRVTIQPSLEQDITIEELVGDLVIEDDKSYLFVMNTISAALLLYQLMKEKVGDKIAYLSSHVVPWERLKRIKEIQNKKFRLAVTTQLVEAGVDIDFDVIYRDIAPLDSLIQSAGRCNRNWSKEEGLINVIRLRDDKRTYSSYIYDSLLLRETEKVLLKSNFLQEQDFFGMVENYFHLLQNKKSSDESRELLEAIYRLRYSSTDQRAGIADFKLIEEDYPKLEVFLEINQEAQEIWNAFLEIKEIKDRWERRAAFDKIKSGFYQFVVSVPLSVENLPPEVSGFRYVNNDSLCDFYDSETGFKLKGGPAIW
ncbi:MAG: CRISPR-associated helicase Cas3' [Candidatus Atribacteria bacterium]|nr:CRISPR-associated helicase Cas3' [Candidatus Atribacteria bacterium]